MRISRLFLFLISSFMIATSGSSAHAVEDPNPSEANEDSIPIGFSIREDWSFSGLPGHEPGQQSIWSAASDAQAIWNPGITSPSPVRISFFQVSHPNSSDAATLEVAYSGNVARHDVDFTKGESRWIELGTYDFSGQGQEYVRLKRETAGNLRASAVKFEILDTDNPDRVWQVLIMDELEIVDPTKLEIPEFADMQEHWAAKDAGLMVKRGYVEPVSENRFAPDRPVTRDWFVSALSEMPGMAGVVQRDARAQAPFTAEDAAMLMRHAMLNSGKNLAFLEYGPDIAAPETRPDAREAVGQLVAAEVLLGRDDPAWSGDRPLNRAQATVLLKRFLGQVCHSGPPTTSQWELTYIQNFRGPGDTLDWDKWWSQNTAYPGSRYGRWPENVVVEDGLLRLVQRKDNRGGREWSAASIYTYFKQAYGYWEARYRYAGATGVNNAFWNITHPKSEYTDRDQHFEIDINEGHYPNIINMTLHEMIDGEKRHDSAKYRADENLSEDFHTYAIEWNEEEIIYYFNGRELERKQHTNCHIPVSIRFSTALIPWAGPTTDAIDGTSMDVEWVRVYKKRK